MLFLDTCMIVPFYVPEKLTRRVQKLFSSDRALAICSLTEVEFHSAISRLVRMEVITPEAGQRIFAEFQNHIRQNLYVFQPISHEVYGVARDWIATLAHSLRTLDAIQLAVAHTNRLPFMTADKPLARTATALGIKVERL